jgi:hypothetical protein
LERIRASRDASLSRAVEAAGTPDERPGGSREGYLTGRLGLIAYFSPVARLV